MAKTSPFGEWLRKWRKARKLTQVELAHRAGCGHSIISQYERGVTTDKRGDFMRPEPDLVERLATALNRPVEEARALAGYMPSPVPPTRKDIEDMIRETGGILIQPNSGQPQIVQLDKETVDQLAHSLAKILGQSKAEANDVK